MARFTSLLEKTLVGKVMELPLDRIVPSPYQPRQNFDEDSLEELKESIRANGLITPITVRQVDGRYEIIAGERRYRACRGLGMEKMPCYILSPDEAEAAQMALVENIQRENLSAVEEAQAYVQIMRQAHLSQEQLAAQIGRSQSSVANKIRLLSLPEEVQDGIRDQKVTERHARALLKLPENEQKQAYEEVVKCGYTVRETEAYVDQMISREAQPPKTHKRQKTKGFARNIQIGINSIAQCVKMIQKMGMNPTMETEDAPDQVTVVIRFPKQ